MLLNFYECRIINGSIINYDFADESINGTHLPEKTNFDVVSFDTENIPMYYFPTQLNEFFENLKSIRIKNSENTLLINKSY